jgi:hypothetical protein
MCPHEEFPDPIGGLLEAIRKLNEAGTKIVGQMCPQGKYRSMGCRRRGYLVLGLFEIRVEVVFWRLVRLQVTEFAIVGTHPGEIQYGGKRLDDIAGRIECPNKILGPLGDYRRIFHVQKLLARGGYGVYEIGGLQVFYCDTGIISLCSGDDLLSYLGVLRLRLDEESFWDEEAHDLVDR